jgi:hypothetical protein
VQDGPSGEKLVRMAFLGVITAHTVNGVAEIHSRILREELFKDFAEVWPDKFTNVTNGVTQRRWLAFCNEPLRRLISQRLGSEDWIKCEASALLLLSTLHLALSLQAARLRPLSLQAPAAAWGHGGALPVVHNTSQVGDTPGTSAVAGAYSCRSACGGLPRMEVCPACRVTAPRVQGPAASPGSAQRCG